MSYSRHYQWRTCSRHPSHRFLRLRTHPHEMFQGRVHRVGDLLHFSLARTLRQCRLGYSRMPFPSRALATQDKLELSKYLLHQQLRNSTSRPLALVSLGAQTPRCLAAYVSNLLDGVVVLSVKLTRSANTSIQEQYRALVECGFHFCSQAPRRRHGRNWHWPCPNPSPMDAHRLGSPVPIKGCILLASDQQDESWSDIVCPSKEHSLRPWLPR